MRERGGWEKERGWWEKDRGGERKREGVREREDERKREREKGWEKEIAVGRGGKLSVEMERWTRIGVNLRTEICRIIKVLNKKKYNIFSTLEFSAT